MAYDVRQRFLYDPIGGNLHRRGQGWEGRGHLDLHVEIGRRTIAVLVRALSDCLDQTQLVERRGAEVVDETAYVADSGAEGGLELRVDGGCPSGSARPRSRR